ncbi:MAG: cation diffusion facilitator family transporter [Bryobacteraceae bacterium]|nr:cation transporter [Solibacteraceae bacterium]MCO5350540.1 cation diffusion facilitator family transporter [Bryobacteraceae bacterium]
MHLDARDAQATGPAARAAMRLSLLVGVMMFVGKSAAWWITGSAAILSDALESVVHVAAVGFAAFSMRLSAKPADERFHYGYERIAFFSAGFEGAMIVIAALAILWTAIEKWLAGLELERLGTGVLLVVGAAVLNGALGWHLIRTGRRTGSLILEANGRHVLTDFWTSVGVIIGLALVIWTGWKPFDPICAILVALQILWSGGQLMIRSMRGLLDWADPKAEQALRRHLDELSWAEGAEWHGLRLRETGGRLLVEVHLLFPYEHTVGAAHAAATRIEEALEGALEIPVEVVTHLEAREDHDGVHREPHRE